LTRAACTAAIKRILVTVKSDRDVVRELGSLIYPVLSNCMCEDFSESTEDGILCLNIIAKHGQIEGEPISASYWRVYSILLSIIAGSSGKEGGFAFEFIAQATDCIQNFIAIDP
jgi:hypothetical protein